MDRYICIHGHFYQPPRENPWLETIELQDSAYPYHNWNERITAEAYAPNARARILDGEGRIVQIVNNYSRMSFDFGPTLLKWLEDEGDVEIYGAIVDADRQSMDRFSGHGSALAQPYNHMIMPLANRRDKRTQMLWGIRDFEHRFQRRPEGMWLPETAVDLETLDIMAQLGIRFTILAQHQASRLRLPGETGWRDVGGAGIDPRMAYFVRLPSGRRIDVFFYDGPVSRGVAFERLLADGEAFAHRLLGGFSEQGPWPQILNIATDGESYGHHHRYGDMALAYALNHIESGGEARLTNYGQYLELHPATHEVQIAENTSWSCGHGVERWRGDCGCKIGATPGWNQAWRGSLREALDWLRDTVAPLYEAQAGPLLRDPWAARDDYIGVILARTPENADAFLCYRAGRKLDESERLVAHKLLELQRHALLMFTSCGWFFDDISGIESTQVLQYAGRVIQLSEQLFGDGIEAEFLRRLEPAKSNVPEHKDGRAIYESFVRPAVVDLAKVAAHFAVSSLFESYPEDAYVFCYRAGVQDYQGMEAGAAKLAVGRVSVTSGVTGESGEMCFGVLHFGDHNITAGVRETPDPEAYAHMASEVTEVFSRADLPGVIRLLDKHFGQLTYSIKSLFRDEQRKILDLVLASNLAESEASYRQVFEHQAPLMRFLLDIGYPLPRSFQTAAEIVLNSNIRRVFGEEEIDPSRVRALVQESRFWNVQLDQAVLAYAARDTLRRLARDFDAKPDDAERLGRLESAVAAALALPFTVDLSGAQNRYYHVLKGYYPLLRQRADHGDPKALDWQDLFVALGINLRVRVE
jgi:alpha-amylase/alpha-mannosidase (GH57 family)